MKRFFTMFSLVACILMTAILPACSAPDDVVGNETDVIGTIYFSVNEQTVEAELYDNATARDLLSRLPLTLEFSDYNSTEKIAYLPGDDLDTSDAPSVFDPSVGDITVYAPWGNLAIFYRDFRNSSGLVPVGRILNDGIEAFAAMSGTFSVTISAQ